MERLQVTHYGSGESGILPPAELSYKLEIKGSELPQTDGFRPEGLIDSFLLIGDDGQMEKNFGLNSLIDGYCCVFPDGRVVAGSKTYYLACIIISVSSGSSYLSAYCFTQPRNTIVVRPDELVGRIFDRREYLPVR